MTIYTAIIGNYEELKEPLIITPGWRYVCYTDQNFNSGVWETVKIEAADPVVAARKIKITGFPDGMSIWCDASFSINVNLSDFWHRHFRGPMTVFPHPWRKRIGDEIDACIKHRRADVGDLLNQKAIYRGLLNMPVIASGILLRESTPEVRDFCGLWFEQISLSTRDQIGFAYAEDKMPIVNRSSGFDYRTDREFIFKTHFNRR